MGTAHPALDPGVLQDARVLSQSWGCVRAGRIQPPARARQRRDGVCELDFTRHQTCWSWMEIGSRSSFLLAPSSSLLLLPLRRVDGLITRGSACSPPSRGAWDLISRLADNLH